MFGLMTVKKYIKEINELKLALMNAETERDQARRYINYAGREVLERKIDGQRKGIKELKEQLQQMDTLADAHKNAHLVWKETAEAYKESYEIVKQKLAETK